ncbi:general transcription factor II-I repeat domain-containing protein 1-like [Dysidea avara]|uniref:general transcription factor II-I repeat domain-containing protein 1-like n=1 Tax=Dysidea avara TaxID=196820 RepID=UPI003326E3B6
MVHHNNNVYHGGTKQGRKFLSENSDISRFTLAVQTEDTHEVVNPKEKALLRIAVQNILNAKYALAVGGPKAHVPYESLQPSLVAGLPPGVEWKRPSHYGINTLKLIVENADNIYFKVGYHNQVQSNASEHVSGDHQGSSQEMQQSLTVQRPGSNNNSVGEGVPMSTRRFSFGEKLDLLYNSKVVARGDAVRVKSCMESLCHSPSRK